MKPMTTLREQVFESLENALDNEGDASIVSRDSYELASELFEYTTFEDENGNIIRVDDRDEIELGDLIDKISWHVAEWQHEQKTKFR